ncbi:hypothetical protein D051_4033 [Vibrio parahaemolyticus VPCR-2010]|nr:hypothetical protein D051_4033 [Vibrio parahaemolyticus VPCR-2010]
MVVVFQDLYGNKWDLLQLNSTTNSTHITNCSRGIRNA